MQQLPVSIARQLLDATPDAMIIVNASGVIVHINKKVEDLFGYSRDELIGQAIEILLPEELRPTHETYRRTYTESPEKRPMGIGLDLLARKKDGTQFPVEISLSPLDIGGDNLFLSTIRDQSELKQLNEQLRILTAAVEAAGSGIIITNVNGTIEWANPAFTRMTGYSKDEIIGKNPRILKSGHHDEEYYKHLWETISNGEVWEGDLINQRKDGFIYHEEQTIAPVKGDGGEVLRYIAVKQDVTARKKIEQEREDLIAQLEASLRKIKTLHGLIPICSHCKKIRDDAGSWHQLESYIRAHSDAEFSHGICDDCAEEHYPNIFRGEK